LGGGSLRATPYQIESKSREISLRQYKYQFDAFFDYAPVELSIKDQEGRYSKVNKQFEKIFGVKNAAVRGKLPTDIHPPILAASTLENDQVVLRTSEITRREEKTSLVSDNEIHTLLTIKFPVFNNEGGIHGLGAIVTDITEEKKAESRFHNMVNAIDGIVWEVDVENDKFSFVSQSSEHIVGYEAVLWTRREFWFSCIFDDDKKRVASFQNDYQKALMPNYEIEYRFHTGDGRVVWLRDLTSVTYENGCPIWSRGVMINISRQKQIEATIISTEQRFRTMFLSAPIGMALCNLADGSLIEVNPAYCRILGRDKKTLSRIGWEKLSHEDDLEEDFSKLQQLRNHEINHYRILKRFLKPDSTIVWAEIEITRIDNIRDSEPEQYLAMLEDISDRKRDEEKIWHQANYDFLTDLPNRKLLQDRLQQTINLQKRNKNEFAVLLIDLDGFKDVNDSLGHDLGDELLIDSAKRIKLCLRESDTVGRLGGDEFVIILSEFSMYSGVERVADNIITSLAMPFMLGAETAYISASIGITLFPNDASDIVGLLKNTDQAMYEAKRTGRNRYQFFTKEMQSHAVTRLQLASELHQAIKDQEFRLVYQPILDLKNGNVEKAETLIRWQKDSGDIVRPVEFIKVAEETHLINEFGDWVFLEASRQTQLWRQKISEKFQIAVNTSPIQFENRLGESWIRYLEKLDIDGSAIGIEITENLLMGSSSQVRDNLLGFRDAGIQVALDDFGTGYSSLSYLRDLDIDYLKIDRSFVTNLTPESDEMALCDAIIVIAHKLGIKVVGEGIETQQQNDLLVSLGCDYGQGYLYSRPIFPDAFLAKYQ
jgi:diguanylate cyclase (GGDEF)-like protein/PAS domain S-box-containing protein